MVDQSKAAFRRPWHLQDIDFFFLSKWTNSKCKNDNLENPIIQNKKYEKLQGPGELHSYL